MCPRGLTKRLVDRTQETGKTVKFPEFREKSLFYRKGRDFSTYSCRIYNFINQLGHLEFGNQYLRFKVSWGMMIPAHKATQLFHLFWEEIQWSPTNHVQSFSDERQAKCEHTRHKILLQENV